MVVLSFTLLIGAAADLALHLQAWRARVRVCMCEPNLSTRMVVVVADGEGFPEAAYCLP